MNILNTNAEKISLLDSIIVFFVVVNIQKRKNFANIKYILYVYEEMSGCVFKTPV